MAENRLYYRDNLDILRRYVKEETVDLVDLDPPFQSNQDYNVLFAEQDGSRSAAQIKAFEDTWRWDQAAAEAYHALMAAGGKVAQAILAFRTFLGESDILAYLAMMAPRLVELHRVLKPTGSLYLHCDPTASHYLKMLLGFRLPRRKREILYARAFRVLSMRPVLSLIFTSDELIRHCFMRRQVAKLPPMLRRHEKHSSGFLFNPRFLRVPTNADLSR
jgi:hypothetical protein